VRDLAGTTGAPRHRRSLWVTCWDRRPSAALRRYERRLPRADDCSSSQACGSPFPSEIATPSQARRRIRGADPPRLQ
jgi:hypothetical protein